MAESPDIIKLLQSMTFQAGRTRRSPGADAIHDLRVSIRRFVQALAVYKECFPPKALKKIRRTLKGTLEIAGEVRNCDVAVEYLGKVREPGAQTLQEKIRLHRKDRETALVEHLNRWVRRKHSVKWRLVLASADLKSDPDVLTRAVKTFFKTGEKASSEKASAKELHALRLAAKRFRYTLELFAPSYEPAANEWLERIARVQTRLGRINDCRAVRSLISRMGGDTKIEAGLKRRQRRRMREFRKLWRDEFSENPPRFVLKKPAGRSTATEAVAVQA